MEEAWRIRKNGSRFWASVVITAQYDSRGALRGFSKITRDITDRRTAEIALGTAREEAERASRAKSEFLSRMSHELRTPLNSILGFAQLLEMEAQPGQQANILHILRGGKHLLGLINEVLDIARIEAGHLQLNLESVPLISVLQEALTLVSPMATSAGIRLLPLPVLPADSGIVADRQRLTQVLLNLLSNAIKYNRPEGQVSIDVSVDQQHIAVSVSDTGKGIAAERLGQLFTPFERLDIDPNIEGSGLGLALSKNLLEMMQGSLAVQSQPGLGSRFTLELPFVRLQDTPVPAAEPIDYPPDLARPGAVHREPAVEPGTDRNPVAAAPGDQAVVEHARATGVRPGRAACAPTDPARRDPAGHGRAGHPATLASVAHHPLDPGADDDRRHQRGYPSSLVRSRCDSGIGQTDSHSLVPRPPRPVPCGARVNNDLRILIIDDQRPNLDLMEQLLVREGLSNVLSSTEPLHLPILVLTADATRDTRLRALALGAKDFISKPLDALETMLRVWNLLETRALYNTLRTLIPADQIALVGPGIRS